MAFMIIKYEEAATCADSHEWQEMTVGNQEGTRNGSNTD